nr:MAG TPA: hypothetical protein [Caudoviricetes sp.]
MYAIVYNVCIISCVPIVCNHIENIRYKYIEIIRLIKTHEHITKSNLWNGRVCSVWQPIENALRTTWAVNSNIM